MSFLLDQSYFGSLRLAGLWDIGGEGEEVMDLEIGSCPTLGVTYQRTGRLGGTKACDCHHSWEAAQRPPWPETYPINYVQQAWSDEGVYNEVLVIDIGLR